MKRLGRKLRTAAGKLATLLADLDYWQRRSVVLSLSPDRYAQEPDRPPQTYSEFLARTPGPLLREPSARARLAGRRVG